MAIYSKRQLAEQQEIIAVVKALTAVTVLRLGRTFEILEETELLLKRIDESIRRVFELYPKSDANFSKRHEKFLAQWGKAAGAHRLLVFIASNEELYGDLILKIGRLFIGDLKASGDDALVIGRIGRIFLQKENIQSRVFYFELDDDKPDLASIQKILEILKEYDKVVIYHGKNQSILSQIATKSEILRRLPVWTLPSKKYFFEPSSEAVLNFLQTQSSINSFHRAIFEAQVARLSARRWSWTKQQLARARLLEELTLEYIKYKKGLLQKQQQVTISAHRLGETNFI